MASLPDAVLEANVRLAYKCVRDVGAMTDDELLTAIHCAGQMSAVADMNLAALLAARDARAGVDSDRDDVLEEAQAAIAAQAALVDQARRERKRVRDAEYRARKRARKLAEAAGHPAAPVSRKRVPQVLADGKRKIALNVTD